MKKLIVFLAAIGLFLPILFSGCSALQENNDVSDLPDIEPKIQEEKSNYYTITLSLYFPDKNQEHLVGETRELIVPDGKTEEAAIVTAVLNGSNTIETTYFGDGISLDHVEMMKDAANVYVVSKNALAEKMKFLIASSITDTLIDYFSISYVSVYFNGFVVSVEDYPIGALKKTTGNISEFYDSYAVKYKEAAANEKIEQDVLLYFLDATGKFFIPEVRHISFVPVKDREEFIGAYTRILLAELAKGPKTSYSLKTCIDAKMISQDMPIVRYDSSIKQLLMEFNTDPLLKNEGAEEGIRAAYASIFYTISGALPDVFRTIVKCKGEYTHMSRMIAEGYAGNMVTIYLPESTMNSLLPVVRTLNSQKCEQLKTYVNAMIDGPILGDDACIAACFPNNITKDDLISIDVKGTVAIVNFSEHFRQQAEQMTREQQTMMFYAIINTLCEQQNIKSVQFFIKGESVENIGGGICLAYPLMPNPGLLK